MHQSSWRVFFGKTWKCSVKTKTETKIAQVYMQTHKQRGRGQEEIEKMVNRKKGGGKKEEKVQATQM